MTIEPKPDGSLAASDATNAGVPTETDSRHTGKTPDVESLDTALKRRQIAKADLEIAQLTKFWPRALEIVQKFAVPMLVIAGALYSCSIGLPQAKRDLDRAQKDAEKEAKSAESAKDQATKDASDANVRVNDANANVAILEMRAEALRRELAALESAVSKDNDQRKSDPQGSKPRVFVQFQGAISREKIDKLRAKLSASGYEMPPAERRSFSYGSQVKYFSKSENDVANAKKIVGITNEFFAATGCPIKSLEPTSVSLPSGKTSSLELWLSLACPDR